MTPSKSIEVVDVNLGKVTIDLDTGQWFCNGKEYVPPTKGKALETENGSPRPRKD